MQKLTLALMIITMSMTLVMGTQNETVNSITDSSSTPQNNSQAADP